MFSPVIGYCGAGQIAVAIHKINPCSGDRPIVHDPTIDYGDVAVGSVDSSSMSIAPSGARCADAIGHVKTFDRNAGIVTDVKTASALITVDHCLSDVGAVFCRKLQTANSEVSADDLDILIIGTGVNQYGVLFCGCIYCVLNGTIRLRAIKGYVQDGSV